MMVVVALYFLIYGGLHFYVYEKIASVTPVGHGLIIAVFSFLVISTLPVIAATGSRFLALRKFLGWICYLWMGYVFLFFSFSLAIDLYRLVVGVLGLLNLSFAAATIRPHSAVIAALVLSLAATAQGVFAARRINIRRIVLRSPKIEASRNPFRIVQISDLHLGLLSDMRQLHRLTEVIRSLEPDVVVSTGDLVDVQLDHLGEFADLLSGLRPRCGKYSVTGNHEAFAGVDRALEFTRRAGFTPLAFSGVTVDGVVNLVGVDDPTVSHRLRADAVRERELLRRYAEGKYTILLKHQPVVDRESRRWFDLQLSGHTHGGQIFPFILLTRLFYRARIGLSRIGAGACLYVSCGTGSWGPPIRFLAPPEVTLIELRSDPDRAGTPLDAP
jgi:predicted MPP superfamily phosphohydrolase